MNWFLDVFSEDESDNNTLALAAIQRLQESDRSGPCEDDCEVTAPFIGMMPEETEHEELSPLDFGSRDTRRIGMRFVPRP